MSEPQVRHQTVMDDEARQVSRVYAEALYKSAQHAGQLEEALSDLEGLVGGVFKEEPGLELLFTSASISRDRKAAILGKAFDGRSSAVFANFLTVLNNHDRLEMIRPIASAFRTLYDRRHKRVVIHVRSAVPLTDEERGRLAADVRSLADVEPIFQETVDPAILGGLIVRVNDWVYDASVRTRLESIKNQLIERGSHGIV